MQPLEDELLSYDLMLWYSCELSPSGNYVFHKNRLTATNVQLAHLWMKALVSDSLSYIVIYVHCMIKVLSF